MQGLVANTDAEWHEYLRVTSPHEEVNFWQPGAVRQLRAIRPGEPVFFKLKSPHNCIAGFGLLARYEVLPLQLAWDCFGHANGTPDYRTFERKIAEYRRDQGMTFQGPMQEIGHIMLTAPVFFPRTEPVAQPADWKPQIVSTKAYSLEHGEGRRIWEECLTRAQAQPVATLAADAPRFGTPYLVAPRLGQGSFRAVVTQAYGRACAVSGEHSLPVLDAAHIKPYVIGGAHAVSNGLVLRSDIHRLFDTGYVTVTPEHCFEVSPRLKQDFSNGRSYLAFHGQAIALPERAEDRPDPRLLQWHNEHCFNG